MYAPNIGRFLTQDTWSGNANQPMSYNPWLYAFGNPIRFTDPTGLTPCSEHQAHRLCVLNNGGIIDVEHFKAVKGRASWLYKVALPNLFGKPFAQVPPIGGRSGGPNIWPFTELGYSATYVTNLPAQGFQGEELGRIVVGITMNYEYNFEIAQGIDPWCYNDWKFHHCSSFSNEDLPSDYLGAISAVKPKLTFDEIVRILGGGKEIRNSLPDEYWGKPGEAHLCAIGLCSNDTPFNDQCTFKVYDFRSGKYYNRPLPSELVVEPFGFGVYWGTTISDFHLLPPVLPALS